MDSARHLLKLHMLKTALDHDGPAALRYPRGSGTGVPMDPEPMALAIGKATARPNLALHRPVTVVTPHPELGRDPSLLVDGDPTNLGFHTNDGPNQNVTIDLGTVQRIFRVVVYNRADCCKERAVPLKIEVSKDNKQFRQVAERKEQFEKWKADFPPTIARYVRLTDLAAVPFHLAEVEVY